MGLSAGKRKAELADYDSAEHRNKYGRVDTTADAQSHVSTGQRFGQEASFVPLSQPIIINKYNEDDEEEDNFNQIMLSSQGYDDSAYASSKFYGTLDTKIVGVRYYSGHATIGEHVRLERQPNNQYDRNAIRVNNVMGMQIGHIPRNVAAKLAKYMDARAVTIEGILRGTIGAYECPIALKIFGPNDTTSQANLIAQMEADNIKLKEFKDFKAQQREEAKRQKQREKERERQQKEAAKRARALMQVTGPGQQWQDMESDMFANLSTPDGNRPNANLEDLINQSTAFNPRDMARAAEKFGSSETDLANLPMAEQPEALATQLLPYQRQGLAWMLEKESPQLPERGSETVVQLWKREGNYYRNIATNYSSSQTPVLSSGGILADDMGLGKTIQIISLITAGTPPKTLGASKATLIISPIGVMSNWKNQIQAHTSEKAGLRVLVYHGSGKKEAAKLGEYDVVITSYGALASEYNPSGAARKTGIFGLHWRRIVLDEGHTIRNPRSKGALAACNVKADSRWTLTGTPIINSLRDLYSQIRFLKLTGGLEDQAIFNSVLIRPLSYGDPQGTALLQAIMSSICLRRRKDMAFVNLRLPELHSHVMRVKFHPHELEKYEMFQSEAKGMLLDYQNQNKHEKPTYSHLLEVLLRLRQVCNHWALCKSRVDKLMSLRELHKVVALTPENIKALQDMLQLQIESQEVCSICLDTLDGPVITACAHSFCRGCIEEVIERQHKCPLCRAEIKDTTTIVGPASGMGEDEEATDVNSDAASSKIEVLIQILTAKGQAEGTKTVVFSQWTSFLDIVEPHLRRAGITFTRIDGKMTSPKRDIAINTFSTDPECTVLLASLSVCSVGLNLVVANQVILADSWWAPAIEDQAVDRVYRLGQTRETTVWRLVMENSIEDHVLEIQEKKRQLSMAALRETGRKKRAEDTASRMADLERLIR